MMIVSVFHRFDSVVAGPALMSSPYRSSGMDSNVFLAKFNLKLKPVNQSSLVYDAERVKLRLKTRDDIGGTAEKEAAPRKSYPESFIREIKSVKMAN